MTSTSGVGDAIRHRFPGLSDGWARFDGPAGTTEFDLQLRDAPEGVVHIKIIKTP